MKAHYKVSRTYDEVTPESAENGDFSDNGFVFEDSAMDLYDVLRELEDCSELSCSPCTMQNCSPHTWASTGFSIDDYSTCTERNESVHITMMGREISGRRLARIYKLAGLIK